MGNRLRCQIISLSLLMRRTTLESMRVYACLPACSVKSLATCELQRLYTRATIQKSGIDQLSRYLAGLHWMDSKQYTSLNCDGFRSNDLLFRNRDRVVVVGRRAIDLNIISERCRPSPSPRRSAPKLPQSYKLSTKFVSPGILNSLTPSDYQVTTRGRFHGATGSNHQHEADM